MNMLSDAGKRHQRLYKVRPLNTPDRLRMYHSMEISEPRSITKIERKTMDTINREKRDSFLLKNTTEMVTNTDYNINQSLTIPSPQSNSFSKGAFTRIIGDIRDQDYSVQLPVDCDHRCDKAVRQKLPQQNSILTTRDTHKARIQFHNLDFDKQLKLDSLEGDKLPSYLKRDKSIVSTHDSEQIDISLNGLLKSRRLKKNLNESFETHRALKKMRDFDHFIGHKYGEMLFKPKKIPQFYDIEKSNESLTRNAMSKPKGHLKFDRYREKIATRFDRADPHWGMTINYEDAHENPQWENSVDYKTVSFDKHLDRQMNEVHSKYPIRQAMELPMRKRSVVI